MSGRDRAPRVVAVAHFPPPVHGMAVAVDRLVGAVEQSATVRRVTVSAPGLDRRSLIYHLVRISRVLRALVLLVTERPRTAIAFFSCDAGAGMIYTFLVTAMARALGYRLYLQHHSYAYIDRPSRLFGVLVRVLGSRCVHLVTCTGMRDDFQAAYPGAVVRVVGIADGIALRDPRDARSGRDHLVLGFLGNVTLEKGIDLAVETVRCAALDGIPVELRVAGPVVGEEAQRVLADAASDPLVIVHQVGPVGGPERDRFLDDLDAFLFPSRYVHESFGLVAWEAMARGVPLIAYRSGCLTADVVNEGGVVIDRGDDFVAAALTVLRRWRDTPALRHEASAAAHVAAAAVAASAHEEVQRFRRDLAATQARVGSSDAAPVRRRRLPPLT